MTLGNGCTRTSPSSSTMHAVWYSVSIDPCCGVPAVARDVGWEETRAAKAVAHLAGVISCRSGGASTTAHQNRARSLSFFCHFFCLFLFFLSFLRTRPGCFACSPVQRRCRCHTCGRRRAFSYLYLSFFVFSSTISRPGFYAGFYFATILAVLVDVSFGAE